MGALIVFVLACWWPSSAPSPSQPLIVEVSLGDTARPDSPPEAGDPRPEAVDPEAKATPEAGRTVAGADPGVEGEP